MQTTTPSPVGLPPARAAPWPGRNEARRGAVGHRFAARGRSFLARHFEGVYVKPSAPFV
jgi:hypothetical protein